MAISFLNCATAPENKGKLSIVKPLTPDKLYFTTYVYKMYDFKHELCHYPDSSFTSIKQKVDSLIEIKYLRAARLIDDRHHRASLFSAVYIGYMSSFFNGFNWKDGIAISGMVYLGNQLAYLAFGSRSKTHISEQEYLELNGLIEEYNSLILQRSVNSTD
ncbi:MAG: hypothetical protein Q8O74_05125 [bacterium]|nr:hypothetical protein [bacterium]